MNKYLALVCCLAALVSARPDGGLGYNYNPGSSDSSFLSSPVTSYAAAASGEDGVNVGFDSGAASSGSVNFLSPGYNVGVIHAGNTQFTSSGSSSNSGSFSGGNLISSGGLSSGGLVSSGGLSSSGGLGYSSGGLGGFGYSSGGLGGVGYSTGRYGSGNLGLTSYSVNPVGGYSSLGGSYDGSLGGSLGSSFGGSLGGSGLSQGYSGVTSLGSTGGGQIVQQQYAPRFQAPIITKSFYVHSAPEDHDEQQIVRYVTIGRPQRNYRVVFINAPSSSSTKAKIIAQVAPVEDKTAIYVLAKKSNDLDISADVVSPAPTAPSKPDVFFIKYKTPAEALNAQRVIQTQYDQLGGVSSFSNEGIAPVQSVIGSGGQSDSSSYANAQGSTQSDVSFNGGNGFGITNIATSPVLPSGGQTNINIGTLSKPLLVPAGSSGSSSSLSSSGLSGGSGINYITTPLVLTSGDDSSSSGASSSSFGSSSSLGGASFDQGSSGNGGLIGVNYVTSPLVLSGGGSSSFGSSSSLGGSFGGLSTDQSQFDQISSGKFTNYLPPNRFRKY